MAKKKTGDESQRPEENYTLLPGETQTPLSHMELDTPLSVSDELAEKEDVSTECNMDADDSSITAQILSLNRNPVEGQGDESWTVQIPNDTVSMSDTEEPMEDIEASDIGEPSGEPAMRADSVSPARKNAATQRAEPSDRQSFFGLDFNELDRNLSDEERQEWNSIYASYRGRSALTGTVIGVDRHTVNVRNRQTGTVEQQAMYCAIVVPFRVRIVIPETEMWMPGQERPGFVLQNMVGATIDFVIIKVDREGGFAIASRHQAARSRRYYFSRRPALHALRAKLKCRVLSVGPRRCLVECHGHDIGLTQRDMRYTAIPDLRTEYHPGQELDCIVKSYDPENDALLISVKETKSNPFEGAELRHPIGSRRQAVISGKYGGGVFCNLPDGTVCMCAYAFQHADSEFQVGDTAIITIQRYDTAKMQIYGKIITKW